MAPGASIKKEECSRGDSEGWVKHSEAPYGGDQGANPVPQPGMKLGAIRGNHKGLRLNQQISSISLYVGENRTTVTRAGHAQRCDRGERGPRGKVAGSE